MQLSNEFQPVRDWANERGIPQTGNKKAQYIKLIEEVLELHDGMHSADTVEIADAIGDCVVVLTNLASMYGMKIEDCINGAYLEIKDRKGKMVDGTFVKDK